MNAYRRGKRLGALTAVVAIALCPSAYADGNTAGYALDTMDPSPAGDRFFLAPNGGVPSRNTFAAKLLESFAYRPLLEVRNGATTRELVSSQLYFDVGASYALLGRLAFSADLPFVPYQGGDTAERGGLGDLRLGARVLLLRSDHADLGTETRVYLPTGSPSAMTGDETLRATQLLTVSGRFSSFVYSASAGFTARKRQSAFSSEVGPAIPFSVAVGVDVAGRLTLGPEVQGFTVVGHGTTLFDDRTTPVLGLFGGRFRAGSLVFGAAAGPGLSHAAGVAPRVALSIAWEPPPRRRGVKVETSVPPTPVEPQEKPPAEPAPVAEAPAPPPEPAQPPEPPPLDPEAARLVARELFQQGIAAFDAGKYDEAADHFARAYEIKPHPAVLRNMALSELMQGKRADACTHFKRWAVEARPRRAEYRSIEASIEEACR